MTISKAELARLSDRRIGKPDLLGVWVNELHSEMSITDFDGTSFNGRYKSKDANNQWVTGSLRGTFAGDTIGFIVNWQPTYNSVTSWAGKLVADAAGQIHISTLWLLASGNEALPLWQSISAGADDFTKQN